MSFRARSFRQRGPGGDPQNYYVAPPYMTHEQSQEANTISVQLDQNGGAGGNGMDQDFRPDHRAAPGTYQDMQNFVGARISGTQAAAPPDAPQSFVPSHPSADSQFNVYNAPSAVADQPSLASQESPYLLCPPPVPHVNRAYGERSEPLTPTVARRWREHDASFYPDTVAPLPDDYEHFQGLSQVITNAVNVDVRNAVPERNPATTGALVSEARRRASMRHGDSQAFGDSDAMHYYAKTTYRANYFYWLLYALSIIASLFYFVVRIIYIAQGNSAPKIPLNFTTLDATGTEVQVSELLAGADQDLEIGDTLPDDLLDNDPNFADLRRVIDDETYSYWWSCVVLAAEIGGFILVHISQQMFVRQDTKFYPLPLEHVQKLRDIVSQKGKLQKVNVMVCTYNEPMETVRECVQYLLDSPAPVYADKHIYIGDDGAKKKFECSDQKRQMVDEFRRQGYRNVTWVGDRKALPHQLNGKSSNINHMVLNHMYPGLTETKDVPYRDILMVMDCDHLVEKEFFAKCCAVMLDRDVAVCLVPQSFHNEVRPDCFDNSNYNFMFRLMPYYFGAGCCFVTGTNVMIRARAAFLACRFDANPHGGDTQNLPEATQHIYQDAIGGEADSHRQLFSETLVAEDIDLGSRVHTLGYKSVFLAEVLAKGEVPRGPRDIWKQRSRWASAAHMYILDPDSVFWLKQRHMTFWQKSLYWIPMVLHFTLIWAEPIMFSMPILCLVGRICPYGVDILLWTTHFFKLLTTFIISSYADFSLELSAAAVYGQTMARVLFWVNVKAVLNTIMVYTGWKRPGAFKVTQKGAPPKATGGDDEAPKPAPVAPAAEVERSKGGPEVPGFLKKLKLYRIHDSLSKITDQRKKCMPWEGTLDFWVLLLITAMNLFSVVYGLFKLENRSAILTFKGCETDNVQLIALVFAFIEATPGLLFIMYIAVQGWAPWIMKIWVPLLIGLISILCILIEARVGIQYWAAKVGADYAVDTLEGCQRSENDEI